MNKKPFLAGQWLSGFENKNVFSKEESQMQVANSDVSPSIMLRQEIEDNRARASRAVLPSFSPKTQNKLNQNLETQGFHPARHFLNGWQGDNLLSKAAIKFKKAIELIYEDARAKFLNHQTFTRSIKSNIYEEFLLFVQSQALNLTELDNTAAFFEHIDLEHSPYKRHIDKFIELYCNRIAVIYYLKLRLIFEISLSSGLSLNRSNVKNPSSFINSLFKKGSSLELHSKAFSQNIFSWYRPNDELANDLFEKLNETCNLTISEIIKHSSEQTQVQQDSQKYSHALSHKNFGLFLNGLLINFPLWIESTHKSVNELIAYGSQRDIEVVSCKYLGDYLESMSVSHWLAQDNNKDMKWDHVLCPNFQTNEFETGQFFGLFNELQFMTFIIQFSRIHNKDAFKFLSEVTKKYIQNKKEVGEQHTLWLDQNKTQGSSYDRVVMNLCRFPKNNPNHYLFNQILENEKKVKEGGFLFVLSHKKLFVPSLKDKVDTLLNSFNLECCLSLDKIKGKGEVPAYIYILKKKHHSELELESKQHCLNFRFEGELETFQDFFHFADELYKFFTDNITERPVMYSRQFSKNFALELYQDAIVEGRLVRSSKKDSASITHPSFFKNLLSSCVPFDTFFEVGSLNENKKDDFALPGFNLNYLDSYPLVAIIDKRERSSAKIEIINYDSYEAKVQQYGVTQCQYFGLRPKLHQVNLNLFREFFDSRLGSQIINITFEGNSKKVKSKLNSMLIPKFFLNNEPLPDHIIRGFTLLNLKATEILKLHPEDLKQQYSYMESFIPSIAGKYPAHTFAMLSFFKNNLKTILENNVPKLDQISFKNPIICKELVKEESHHIYPGNAEVYVEFAVRDMKSVNRPLTSIELNKTSKISSIALKSDEEVIATLNCPEQIASLLEVILGSLIGQPVTQLLVGIKVPSNERLKAVLENQELITSSFRSIYNSIQNNLDKILTNLINQS